MRKLLLLPILSFSLYAADKPALDAERLARIAPRMKAFVDRGDVAGIVTLVAHRGIVVHHEAVGYMDLEAKKPMAKDSIFQIMSMTKPMVAVAIMMLAEEGRLAATDPVERHLPEFRGQMMVAGTNADGSLLLKKPSRTITIRDLLTHTSGVIPNPPPGLAELYQTMDRTLAEAVSIYSQTPLQFEPGTKWMYSNPGIATLGRIIEVAADQPFERFMDERLFRPLGMKDTFLFPPADKMARIAPVYQARAGKLEKAPATILGGDSTAFRKGAKYPAPEFGAYSTAADLAAFYEMTRAGGMYNGKRLLSKTSVDMMTALHTGDISPSGHEPGVGYGLAWTVVKDPIATLNFLSLGTFGHGGAFGTNGWVDRKKEIVGVYLVQGGTTQPARNALMQMAGAALVE